MFCMYCEIEYCVYEYNQAVYIIWEGIIIHGYLKSIYSKEEIVKIQYKKVNADMVKVNKYLSSIINYIMQQQQPCSPSTH